MPQNIMVFHQLRCGEVARLFHTLEATISPFSSTLSTFIFCTIFRCYNFFITRARYKEAQLLSIAQLQTDRDGVERSCKLTISNFTIHFLFAYYRPKNVSTRVCSIRQGAKRLTQSRNMYICSGGFVHAS